MIVECEYCQMTVQEVPKDTEILECKFCGNRTELQ